MMVNKKYDNGTVAVLYSPGYGAGWSTWNESYKEFFTFDAGLVELAQAGASEADVHAYLKTFPNLMSMAYLGGWRDIKVMWLPKGTAFRIDEYDGNEDIEYLGEVDWLTA